MHLFQQGESVFRGNVRSRSCTGKVDFYDRLGKTAALELTTRHADTSYVDTPHSRRRVTISDWVIADLVDEQDIIRILMDPKSEYARSHAMALNRTYDDLCIAALYAAVDTGETGGTSVAFSADWRVTRSNTEGDRDSSAAALTVAELLVVKGMLDISDVPPTGRHIVVPPAGINQLLATTQVSSSDYNTVKALAMGQIDTFAGFKFHQSNRCPLAASTDYYGFAWHEDALAVSTGMEVRSRVSQLPGKNYSYQVHDTFSMGAVRTQGEGVVRWRLDVSL